MAVLAAVFVTGLAFGQTSNQVGQPLWQPNKAVCDSYGSEKKAVDGMSPAVKSVYNAGKDTREEALPNAVYNIYCNPPRTGGQPAPNQTAPNNGRALRAM